MRQRNPGTVDLITKDTIPHELGSEGAVGRLALGEATGWQAYKAPCKSTYRRVCVIHGP